MSRCFPYPPPGCTLSSARKEALIESIKLQKEKVKAEEQRKKEKKKQKKDKKKEKTDRKNPNLIKSDLVHGHIGEKFWTDPKVFHKGNKVGSEQLERSSLTVELEKPVYQRAPSSSSDSTGNSNKRKRDSSPLDVSCGHGKIIRIRLSSKKQNQSDALAKGQQLCSTSGRIDFPSWAKDDVALRHRSEGCPSGLISSGNVGQRLVLQTDREQISSAFKQIETTARKIVTPATEVFTTPMQKEGLVYRKLIESWVPPQLQNACLDTRDEDWLFSGKNIDVPSERRCICRDDGTSCSSTSELWPRARYLPEVNVHALPYTVPF